MAILQPSLSASVLAAEWGISLDLMQEPAHREYLSIEVVDASGERVVAEVAVDGDAFAFDYTGLAWRNGRVAFEFSGSLPVHLMSIEEELRAVLLGRLRNP